MKNQKAALKVLLVAENLIGAAGGGQRYFCGTIRNQPDIQFFAFGESGDANGELKNLTQLPLLDLYRKHANSFDLSRVLDERTNLSLHGKQYDLCFMLDVAASVACMEFDVIEVPDYLPMAAFLRDALQRFQVRYGKLVLSMHGTLAFALRENWGVAEQDVPNIELLERFETMLFRSVDLRYGIGEHYVQNWSEREHLPSHLVSAAAIYAHSQVQRQQNNVAELTADGVRPDLVFIGRHDRCKGPDLFVDIVSKIPPALYGKIRIIGSEVKINNVSSRDEMNRMAQRRGINVQYDQMRPDEIDTYLEKEDCIVFVVSRRDTFNLVALEAVQARAPLVISRQCGAYRYLRENYSEDVALDISVDNISEAVAKISQYVRNYRSVKASLLKKKKLLLDQPAIESNRYQTVQQVYAAPSHSDERARMIISDLFARAMQSMGDVVHRLRADEMEQLWKKFSGLTTAQLGDLRTTAYASSVLRDIIEPMKSMNDMKRLEHIEKHVDKMGGLFGAGNRIPLLKHLAEWERQRGNPQNAAVYEFRRWRLQGSLDDIELSHLINDLNKAGYHKEAEVAQMLIEGLDGQILEYLQRRIKLPNPVSNKDVPKEKFFIKKHGTPAVSLIVSLYNAKNKLDVFLQGLLSFTEESRRITEVIFVDSNSQDGTETYLPPRLQELTEAGISSCYMRTVDRETIQTAWNRGIAEARGRYLAFLGVDEMVRGDAFATLTQILDSNPGYDWLQGNAVVTLVDDGGGFVKDEMFYRRISQHRYAHHLDCCFISYVGSVYRKEIHERVGYYDGSFRGAGDTDFKNRALPFIHVHTLDETLGFFLNYPEARVTQSPLAEIEDIRASYLYRSVPGLEYAYAGRPELARQMVNVALCYKKSYREQDSLDVFYAYALCEWVRRYQPQLREDFYLYDFVVNNCITALRLLDGACITSSVDPLLATKHLVARIERTGFLIGEAARSLTFISARCEFALQNENSWHTHAAYWKAMSKMVPVEGPLTAVDIAGPQDMAELLASTRSKSEFVNFEVAWQTGKTEQIFRLFKLSSIDVLFYPAQQERHGMRQVLEQIAEQNSVLVHGNAYAGLTLGANTPLLFTGEIESIRPVATAVRCVLFDHPEDSEISRVISQICQYIVWHIPIILPKAAIPHLQALLGNVDFEIFLSYQHPQEIPQLLRLIRQPDWLSSRKAALQQLSENLIANGRLMVLENHGSLQRIVPQAGWDHDVAQFNRLIRKFVEGSPDLNALLDSVRESLRRQPEQKEKFETILHSLADWKEAPILKTGQAWTNKIGEHGDVSLQDLGKMVFE